MDEVLSYLMDYIGEGAAATADVVDEAASPLAEEPKLNVETEKVEEATKEAANEAEEVTGDGKAVEVSPKPKPAPSPKSVKQAASSIKVPNLEAFPTPGGIQLALFVVLFVVFVLQITPNGYSRIATMWAALQGRASIASAKQHSQSWVQQIENDVQQWVHDATQW